MKKNTNSTVMQSYSLTIAKHTLSAVEMRIMAHILIKLKDEQINQYENNVINTDSLLSDYTTIKINSANVVVSDNHADVKRALSSLRKRDIETKGIVNGVSGVWIDGLISRGWYSDDGGEINIEVSPSLLPHLIELGQNYTKHGLEFLFKTSSAHAIRWYQIGSHWLNKGTFYISKDDIRDIFGLAKKYKAHKDFEKKVMINPFKEVNEKSNINIEIAKKHKQGRRIIGFTIKVKNKQKQENKKLTDNCEPDTLNWIDNLTDTERKIIMEKAEQYITKLEITDEKHKQNIYKKALAESWGLADYQKEQAEEEKRKKRLQEEKQKELERKKAEEEKRKQEQKELDECEMKFLALPQVMQNIVLEALENRLPKTFKKRFRTDLEGDNKAYRLVEYAGTFKQIMKDF